MIDSHCHLNDEAFANDIDAYIKESKDAGVSILLVIGWDVDSSKFALELAHKYENVYAAIGIQPENVKDALDGDIERIEKLLSDPNVAAVGEIGLDYHWENDEKTKLKQHEYFIKQLQLANKYDLPVSIHSRDACLDTLNILKKYSPKRKGVLHCYSNGPEALNEFLKLGYIIGIGGTSTFKNAKKPQEVARIVPLDKFVLETDAPYLAPEPYRGHLNHSKYIPVICNAIAKLKNTDPKIIEESSDNNFKKMFLFRDKK